MNARGLSDALHRLWPHCDPEKTVDRVIAGEPGREIVGVAVCWMPSLDAIEHAAARGLTTLVAHEPTFYDHYELRNEPGHPRLQEAKRRKEDRIRELGVTILRCHDVWDAIPKVGVPFEWGRFLGFGEPVRQSRYVNVYAVAPRPAGEVARTLAVRTAVAGQRAVEFYGDPDRIVQTVGVGTGCYSEAFRLMDEGADLAVTVDDIARCWIIGSYCNDTGQPLVVVNHGVSEACAMGSLADAVRNLLPGVPVEVIPQGASYREIFAD